MHWLGDRACNWRSDLSAFLALRTFLLTTKNTTDGSHAMPALESLHISLFELSCDAQLDSVEGRILDFDAARN
jgi:hypothetical protein